VTVLLVDLGNTRIKWARLGASGPGRMRAAAHRGWRRADFVRALFPAASAARAGRALRRSPVEVVAVSVAAPALERRFTAAVRAATGAAPRFCRSERAAGGVRNGYRDTWRLGADRWVALLGARASAGHRAVCVVDIGTATTIDLIDASGRHRGGAILPGPDLMIAALLRDTGGIRRRAQQAGGTGATGSFARDTAAALRAGAVLATAGAIERAWRDAGRELGGRPQLLLTGGAAAAISAQLGLRHSLWPDLVLRGLAVLAQSGRRA
jgi:type III pantothenate kinase